MAQPKLKQMIKSFFTDSMFSIAALILMNVVSQFIVYPLWARKFGDEIYGNIIYVMSILNIGAVSIGVAANYARMTESATRETCNGDYNKILSITSVGAGLFCVGVISFSNIGMSSLEVLLSGLLCILMLWRYYADVEYRINLNYKGYFLYYFVISVGYCFGAFLFWHTSCWPLALLFGEAFGLIWVAKKGSILNKSPFKISPNYCANRKVISTLICTNLMSNAIFNGDRLLLQLFDGGKSVTIYYLSSLIGKTMSLITTPLNSVIIGYLVRYKGKFNKKMVHGLMATSLGVVVLCTVISVIGSHIIIYILYPNNYQEVKMFFWIANLTQVLYFVTNIITTVLLRMAEANCQFVINIIYMAAFLVLCIPGTMMYGISGFCITLLCANLVRYISSLIYCYKNVEKA